APCRPAARVTRAGRSAPAAPRSAICIPRPGPALLVFFLSGIASSAVLLGTIEIALRLLITDLQFVEPAALLGIVHAAKRLAGLHLLAFANAEINQPAPLQRHHLGPARWLDRTGAIDCFRHRRLRRDRGRHGLDMDEVGPGIVAATPRGDQEKCD